MTLKADSHVECRAHAMPMPCPCHAHAMPIPCPCHAHAMLMPCPCRAHNIPLPCRAAKGLDCVFPTWFTQCGLVWFTLAMLHVRRETAYGLPARVRLLPATTRISTKAIIRSIPISDAGGQCETKQRFSWTRKRGVGAHYTEKDDLLNCWISSSDISGYHADFHEGHGTIGARQVNGMACVN